MNSFSKRITQLPHRFVLERQMQAMLKSVDAEIKIELIKKTTEKKEIAYLAAGIYRIFLDKEFFESRQRELILVWHAAHILEHHFNTQHALLKHSLAVAVWFAFICKRARIKAAQEAFDLRGWLLFCLYREDDEDNGFLGGFLGSYLLWHEATKSADDPAADRLGLLEFARSKPNLTPFLADHDDIPDFKEKQ